MWPQPIWRAGAFVLGILGAASASAGTPEEAVAYLVSGIVDGATIGTSVFKKTKDSPAIYEARREKPNPHEPRVGIVVTRKTDCVFDITLTMDQGKGSGSPKTATVDFSKVSAMEYAGKERVKVTGKDYCRGDIPPACDGRLAVDVAPDKYKAAYADLRRSCR